VGVVGTFLKGAVGTVGGAKYWLIAIAAVAVVSFGLGYVRASKSAEGILADRVASATAEGAKAQHDSDEKDWAVAKIDFTKRTAADLLRNQKVITITKEIPILVPQDKACELSANAMKALNEVTK